MKYDAKNLKINSLVLIILAIVDTVIMIGQIMAEQLSVAEFLTEHGVDGTTEAFEALVKEKKQTRTELTDKELEEAVGGKDGYADWGVDWSDNGYVYDKSKVKFDRLPVLLDYNEQKVYGARQD